MQSVRGGCGCNRFESAVPLSTQFAGTIKFCQRLNSRGQCYSWFKPPNCQVELACHMCLRRKLGNRLLTSLRHGVRIEVGGHILMNDSKGIILGRSADYRDGTSQKRSFCGQR